MSTSSGLTREGALLRRFALRYPEAYEEMPWGHHAIKVRGKTFVFLSVDEGTFSLSTKLPSSAGVALSLPFASPTEYGLGQSGWVTGRFPRGARLPLETLKLWIDESYRAVAPKRLAGQLGGADSIGRPRAASAARSRKKAKRR